MKRSDAWTIADVPPEAANPWQCFLMPVQILMEMNFLPAHEICRRDLEHLVIPRAEYSSAAVASLIQSMSICSVSWRWGREKREGLTELTIAEWTPMSSLQFSTLKALTKRSNCDYIWIDWCCVPQLSADTMTFINSSHDIYSHSRHMIFLPRKYKLERRGWPLLRTDDANSAIRAIKESAEQALTSKNYSQCFKRVLAQSDHGLAERIEARANKNGVTSDALQRHIESACDSLKNVFLETDITYSSLEHIGRVWTLGERLARFKPGKNNRVRFEEICDAGELLLYCMVTYWRDAGEHAPAAQERSTVSEADLATAVYLRGVDPTQPGAHERWDDLNRLAQVVPDLKGVPSETAALALICVEWLLHERTGVGDRLGKLAALLLGECIALVASSVTSATLLEEASREWFRKYLHFDAGAVYESSIAHDAILAVYLNCGMQRHNTAEATIAHVRQEVFGQRAAQSQDWLPELELAFLTREALQHENVQSYLRPREKRGIPNRLCAVDFVPMLGQSRETPELTVAAWSRWLASTGLITCWWFTNRDMTVGFTDSGVINVEHLFFDVVENVDGLPIENLFRRAATIIYSIERYDDLHWRLIHITVSRRDGYCGEWQSRWRVERNLSLKQLLEPDIVFNGRVTGNQIVSWNKRCLSNLHDSLEFYWLQCIHNPKVCMVS